MKFNNISQRFFLFLLVFLTFWSWLFSQSLIAQSGDANDIWKAILSYYTNSPTTSYVMYKGILSVFPYVWLYELAKFFQIDHFFFIKILYSLMFSFITTIGMPNIWNNISKRKTSNLGIIIFSGLLFLLWQFNYALNNLIIDLPNLTILIVSTVLAIKINKTKLDNVFYSILGGFFFGLLLCGSGQYQLSFYALVFFVFLSIVNKLRDLSFKQIVSCLLMGLSIFTVLKLDANFLKRAETLADQNQEWFLTKKEWLDLSLSGRNMLWLKYGGGPVIDNGRFRIIGETANQDFIEKVSLGLNAYLPTHYFKLMAAHPIELIVQSINKIFLAVSLDNGNRSVAHLWLSYTLLYLSVHLVYQKIKKASDFANSNFLLVLAFILPSLTPLLFHVEMRYFLSIQILIISTAIFGNKPRILAIDQVKNILLSFKKVNIKDLRKLDFKINYNFVFYLIFIFVCFSWYASIYENSLLTKEILFRLI